MSSKTLFVRPSTKGLICRHPHTNEILPEAGADWPNNILTRRSLNAGDIVIANNGTKTTVKKGGKK